MNNFREEEEVNDEMDDSGSPRASVWPGVIIVALILVAGLAIVYAHSQKSEINAMAARDASLHASVAQLQTQLQSTTAKLNDMVAQQQAAAAQAAAQAQAQAAQQQQARALAARRSARLYARRREAQNSSQRRYTALQSRLDAQQKELDATNQSIAKARADLQANLDSTAAGLNGSIAKNHDELVALEKRGQRDYFEFDLSRSKDFSRTGPISLSLRHADAKHDRYNMMLLVDDNRLEKKNVDLYEPVWISSSDAPQPLEIVVNKITKNHIHGYVSAPKFTNAQLNAAGSASLQPVSASAQAAAPVSNGNEAGPAGSAQPSQAALTTPAVQPR